MERLLTRPYQKIALRLITLFAFCSTLARLFFGVEFTDESQYVAQIVGPLNGGDLFLTDRLFQQSGSILATPFAYLYTQLVGSTTGVVLFLRLLFFATSTVTAIVFAKALSKRISIDASVAISALSISYIPYNLPSVSYNSMAVLLTTLSLALTRIFVETKSRIVGIWLAVATSLGIYSYPPLCIGYLVLFLFYFRDRTLRRPLLFSAAWAAGILTILLIPVVRIGLEELEKNLAIAKLVSLLTFADKVQISIHYLSEIAPSWPFICAVVIVGITLFIIRKPFELVALPIFAVFYIYFATFNVVDVGASFLIFGVLISLCFSIAKKIRSRDPWSININIAVAIIVGLIVGTTSSNGMLNSAMGFSIALLFLFESYILKHSKFPWASWISAVAVLCFAQWTFFYRESSLPLLTHMVESGPYAGLFTSNAKKNFLVDVESDLNSLPKNAKSILSYDSFPAGYLFTNLKPQTFMYYMHPAAMAPLLRPLLVQMFSLDSNLPDVVLEMIAVPVTDDSAFLIKDMNQNIYKDPFWNFIKDKKEYRVFIQRQHYTLYIKNSL